jgi:hypothetical protein
MESNNQSCILENVQSDMYLQAEEVHCVLAKRSTKVYIPFFLQIFV